jgi:signal transduction histidine kinase
VLESTEQLDVWERRLDALARAIPYVALLLSTVLYVVTPGDSAQVKLVNLAIAGVAAGWMLWWFTLHPAWRGRPAAMAVFFVGLLVCYAVLALRNPLFGFFAFAGYIYALEVLPGRWKFAGVAVNAVPAATSLSGGIPRDAAAVGIFLVVVTITVGLSCVLVFLGHVTSEQSRRRKEMVRQLAEANDRLTEAMRENEGLHEQLLAQAREAGVHDERQRMAQEIHDTLAQGLTGIITQLQAAEQAEDWRRHVAAAAQLARDNLADARRSVRALRPAPLEGAALPDALADVVGRWSDVHGVRAELATTGEVRPMHPEIEVALLRIAQEALANVAKHARACRVGLTLSYMRDVVTLDVRDDGVGFDPAVADSGGFGLVAMRQRVDRLAGALEVESEQGAGTAVSVRVPALAAEVPS